jgi:catechol 2,3-dioxygenase-like lactoylglutathione lyase family enzyme
MKRMHVMLRVKDLDEATRFYSSLFDAEPTTQKPDYAKWMLDDPRVNFSIAEKDEDFGIEHLGIQAETPDELEELRGRIDRAGGTVNNEGETTCCYANSDKTWVVDQQGVSWEAFYTSGEAETYRGDEETACCETG